MIVQFKNFIVKHEEVTSSYHKINNGSIFKTVFFGMPSQGSRGHQMPNFNKYKNPIATNQ